ncbi:hypothetical protein O3597_14090 [Verrucosispora sp. WMMA2044]|uniref:hypothetical protein n=1 Tax=Verrucosispora sp. WMMA2044 TaxID=3016419 RepID=UPI00248BBD89|nr:hypothetical protein [Verrucosispora sp. WMMA2044]WBB51526.1 hypothetical protein O3597_14090 [Verrucosispora sp. WMMA2044]
MTVRPEPGDLLRIDSRASVQFAGRRALTLRVVSASDRHAYDGWIWLTGYVIDRRGNATAKREVYVRLAGLRAAPESAPAARTVRGTARQRPWRGPLVGSLSSTGQASLSPPAARRASAHQPATSGRAR